MNNPARKRAHTIIVAIVFLLIYTFVMFFAQQKNYEKLIVMHNRSQAESVCAVLDQYERKEIKVGEAFTDDLNAETSLKAIELAAGITNGNAARAGAGRRGADGSAPYQRQSRG